MSSLAERGIGTRPFFLGLHEQPVLIELGLTGNISLPVTEKASIQGFYLPSSVSLKESDITFYNPK